MPESRKKSLLRRATVAAGVLLALGALGAGAMVWQNNRDLPPVESERLQASFDASVNWAVDNRNRLLRYKNQMLWWMIMESAERTGDERLAKLFADYKALQIDPGPMNVWDHLFDRDLERAAQPIERLRKLADYNVLYLYALTCDDALGNEPLVANQFDPDYCGVDFLGPRCVTHQAIGMLLMRDRNCGDPDELNTLSAQLEDRIIEALASDPRVGDAYLQRVATLVATGAAGRVKPVWIERILAAQNADGGWDDVHPIVPLPGGGSIGLTSNGVHAGKTRSDFHATAQGIWLFSHLTAQAAL